MARRANQNTCAGIILAAGRSERLGMPKQLVPFQGTTLLDHAIQVAKDAGLDTVVVVLGAYADAIQSASKHTDTWFVIHPEWHKGMASSLVCGLKAVLEHNPDQKSVIFMVCDQPGLHKNILKRLIKRQYQSGSRIIAAAYGDGGGTPALFTSAHFDELLRLEGEKGAGKLLRQYANEVVWVPFPKGWLDIDTMDDIIHL